MKVQSGTKFLLAFAGKISKAAGASTKMPKQTFIRTMPPYLTFPVGDASA